MNDNFLSLLKEFKDCNNKSLYEISCDKKTLVVFLRHSGCIFCRETLSDLSSMLKNGELDEYNLVLVHMSCETDARRLFEKYGLASVSQISDSDQILYKMFGLKRGNMVQLFGPKNWIRGISAMFSGNFQGKVEGDGFQMPGIFVLDKGEIIRSFIHKSAADKPDYNELISCEI